VYGPTGPRVSPRRRLTDDRQVTLAQRPVQTAPPAARTAYRQARRGPGAGPAG